MAILTQKERKEIVDIFRRLSRKENLSKKEARPAVQYLLHQPGSSKVEKDVWNFFSECAPWFYKKEQTFAEASDVEVLRQTGNRFRAYLGAESTTEPCPKCNGTGQDSEGRFVCQVCWGAGCIPKREGAISFADLDGAPVESVTFKGKRAQVTSMSWTEEVTPTQYAEDQAVAEVKRDKKYLKFLTSPAWKKKEPWYQMGYRRFIAYLKRKVEHQDDPDAQAEDARRAGDEVMKAIKEAEKRGKSR